MKTYRELNLEEKSDLEKIISEVVILLPKDNTFFESEKKNDNGQIILKTKQDYNDDKNTIIHIIEEKRQIGIIDKQKSKEMKIAISILFNEFIRISPRKIYQICKEIHSEKKVKNDAVHIQNELLNMKVTNWYVKIQGTYIELPEKIMYKVYDIPENDEMQKLEYIIVNNEEKNNENQHNSIQQKI